MLFGGNLIRQPAFIELKKDNPNIYKIAADTKGSDQIMHDTLFLGTYPGLTKDMMDFEIEVINNFTSSFKNKKINFFSRIYLNKNNLVLRHIRYKRKKFKNESI